MSKQKINNINGKDEFKEDKNRTILIVFFYIFFILIMLVAFSRGYFDWDGSIPDNYGKDNFNEDTPPIEEEKNDNKDKEENKEEVVEKVINIIKEPEEEVVDPGVFSVRDDNIKWETASKLQIFDTPKIRKLVVNGKLAPGLSSEYTYIVRNNTGVSILYDMKFEILNEENFDIRYRLKESNNYLIGSETVWETVDNTELTNFEMNTGDKKEYILEWKWFEGENDNQYGTSSTGKYEIKTDIRAKEKIGE